MHAQDVRHAAPKSATVYYEDLELEDWFDIGEYYVDRDEVIAFASAWDPQPFHIDESAARDSIFGCLTGSSLHAMAALSKVSACHGERIAVLANLSTEFNMPNPMRVGDTLQFKTTAKEKRLSKSRRNAGIIKFQSIAINQVDEVILNVFSTTMVACRPG